jgi:hypothetical protein
VRAFKTITPLSKALSKKFKAMEDQLKEYNLRQAHSEVEFVKKEVKYTKKKEDDRVSPYNLFKSPVFNLCVIN